MSADELSDIGEMFVGGNCVSGWGISMGKTVQGDWGNVKIVVEITSLQLYMRQL